MAAKPKHQRPLHTEGIIAEDRQFAKGFLKYYKNIKLMLRESQISACSFMEIIVSYNR